MVTPFPTMIPSSQSAMVAMSVITLSLGDTRNTDNTLPDN